MFFYPPSFQHSFHTHRISIHAYENNQMYVHEIVLLCVCHKESDAFGDHALMCYTGGDPYRKYLWHDPVVRTIGSFHQSLGIPYTIEPRDLVPGRNKRPDIIVHYLDEMLSYDVRTCVSTRDVTIFSSQQGYDAENGARLKEKALS